EPGERLLDLVLHLDLGDVRVRSLLESGRNGHRSARGGGGIEIEQAVDPGQLLLDDLGDAVLHRLGRSAGIGRADVDLWRGDVGILLDRESDDRAHPHQHDDDRDHPGENRAIDEDPRHQPPLAAPRPAPPPAWPLAGWSRCGALAGTGRTAMSGFKFAVPWTITLSPGARPWVTTQ